MTPAKKIIWSSAAVLVVAAALAVKWFFFPSVKDAYFTMNDRTFRQVPSGLVAVRPTHFPKSVRKGILSDNIRVAGRPVWRMMGRNITLEQLIGVAYGRSQARVVLPASAPKTNFDFIVTARGDLQKQLQKVIRKKLGLIAQTETRDEDVLTLKIANASLPGLTASDASTQPNVNFKDGKLYFTHMRLQAMTGGLEQMLKMPIVDKTDLTNFYDFTAAWDSQMQRQLQNEATASAAIKKILGGWGLALEPASDRVEVLVVKNAT